MITVLLVGCCPKDYTSEIRRIMVPMQKNLKVFFEEEGIYPSTAQRDILVEKSGCKITDSQKKTCIYKNRSFTYESNLELTQNRYFFSIAKKGNHCSMHMTTEGKMEKIQCIKESCITL
jgi:hypothetical protein